MSTSEILKFAQNTGMIINKIENDHFYMVSESDNNHHEVLVKTDSDTYNYYVDIKDADLDETTLAASGSISEILEEIYHSVLFFDFFLNKNQQIRWDQQWSHFLFDI